MARIRTIKPEFWHDEKIGNLKRDERLLFIGLWNQADDEGVVKANPVFIKSSIFPYDEDLRIGTLTSWLSNLQKARMLIPFTFNGESYYVIRTFLDHQVINRPSKSKWPADFLDNLIHKNDENTHGALTEGSQQEREQGKGNGKEGEKEDTPEDPADDCLKKNEKPVGKNPDPPFEKKLNNPFSENFLIHWNLWKQYKKEQFKYNFKSLLTEQASLNDLFKISKNSEEIAVAIIEKSIASGWKGLFELKDFKNGKNGAAHKQNSGRPVPQTVSTGGFGSL